MRKHSSVRGVSAANAPIPERSIRRWTKCCAGGQRSVRCSTTFRSLLKTARCSSRVTRKKFGLANTACITPGRNAFQQTRNEHREKGHGVVILVESSIWVMVEHQRIVLDAIVRNEEVAVCPPVVQEVLQGANSRRLSLLQRAFYDAAMLDAPLPFERFEYAVQIYRDCRDAGITPRSGVDCLIAAIAIAYDVPLLHDDRDFEHIKRVAPLKTLTL